MSFLTNNTSKIIFNQQFRFKLKTTTTNSLQFFNSFKPTSRSQTIFSPSFSSPLSSNTTRSKVLSRLNSNHRTFSTSKSNSVRSYYGKQSNATTRYNQPEYFRKFNLLPSNYILYGIIGINLAVFGAWKIAETNAIRFRDNRLMNFMEKNFTSSIRNLKEGRIWTLITSCFSHSGAGHIFTNLITLYFMAGPVLSILGNVGFLTVYLGGGLLGSTVSLFVHRFIDRYPNRYYSSHGASSAVYSTLVFFACAMPTTTFLIMFVIPVPAWLCVGGLIGYDTYQSIKQSGTGTTDSAGHLGGAAAGALFFLRKLGRI